MSVSVDDVKSVARLARLRFEEAELEVLAGEMNQILKWVDQLREVNTEGVEPLQSVVSNPLPLRQDMVNDGNIRDQIFANTTHDKYDHFGVPKVVE